MRFSFCTILSLIWWAGTAQVHLPARAAPRVRWGAQRLAAAMAPFKGRGISIVIDSGSGPAESYRIDGGRSKLRIRAADASGALYGCLDLSDRLRLSGWPAELPISEKPGMVLRGACIGLQKPTLLPGRGPYEYPYTPVNFPWFYDRALWTRYLDSMAGNRLNTLYLWNGHPFASLVRLKDYPYAVEVDDATFRKNEETYRWLTTEADKRGIWVIQVFYNIIVSKPFAEHNHLKTQDRNRHIVPLIADYTRKSIAAFVEKYPNVGLMFTLGEAMEGVGQDDIDWLTKTIIPGVKDGLRALGRTDEPPLVLRAHDTDGPADLEAALPLYKNLYVVAKYNGEALTTYTPHGSWADLHRRLSGLAKGLMENVHIMANLEPFRYGSPDFIQRCVQAMHSVYHATALHLYPQASYWDWPYSADSVKGGWKLSGADGSEHRLYEMDRDWIWYKAWARYAWNCNRPRNEEVAYWSTELARKYGCDTAAGHEILRAYEESGEIAPRLLRRFGITDGNRQTLSLGMLMTQLIDPERYGVLKLLYESEGPPGETLATYAEREWKGLQHEGETPVDVIHSTREEGQAAVAAIEKAAPHVRKNMEEFGRLQNDMNCYEALADFYDDKAEAALSVLRYNYSGRTSDLQKALAPLQASVDAFRRLASLATPAYRYANSMQTRQRKIPVRGAGGKFTTWKELLPLYEEELQHFRAHLESMPATGEAVGRTAPSGYQAAKVSVTEGGPGYAVDSGAHPFSDTGLVIRALAAPLRGLAGMAFPSAHQRLEGTRIVFTCRQPVTLLVGFFSRKSSVYLAAPQLETDASANDYGQAEPRIANALEIAGMPPVDVHAWSFTPGEHTLTLGKGLCVVLGFVKPMGKARTYDAGIDEPGSKNLDWLFE